MIVWDIDGTLANPEHRKHLLPKDKEANCLKDLTRQDIATFMDPSLIALDSPIEPAMSYFKTMVAQNIPFRLITARYESIRLTTLRWFHKHDCPVHTKSLLMRKDADIHRPSVEVKLELAKPFLPFIHKWFDDDPGMIAALIRCNVPCCYVPDYWETIK